jgi:DNA-directed RNA polymerase specialized sigma24 family protein
MDCRAKTMAISRTTWPPMPSLEEAFTDEFGEIRPDAYKAARELWSHSESFVLSTLGDPSTGQRLMFKAAALVSRQLSQSPDRIDNLHAYLRQTFKRLTLDELKKENSHRDSAARAEKEPIAAYLFGPHEENEEDLNRKILIQQVIRLMDKWALDVL